MPEARIPLAQAAVYIAAAPKSNSSYVAINKALVEVERGPRREVPNHLKDSSRDQESLGHGKGLQIPPRFSRAFHPPRIHAEMDPVLGPGGAGGRKAAERPV
jgi:putative ATPase